ncbi:MAG: sigma-70 family RNA polymerase sigma factor [Thermoanaerobaculales bacterium]|nr:sigma-70 family RNA polymerase sigma factor [Thermoanaerobaculales bacterium]
MGTSDLEVTVERCRSGDEEAWAVLVSTTMRPLYRLCASYAPSAAEAEELTQEIYFKLWENLHRYRAGSNFMAWAWRVAKNLLIDAHRRSRREREAAWLDPEIIDRLPSGDDPHGQTENKQRLKLIAAGLRQLDSDLSELVLMRDFAGFTYQEMADALELPLGTVKSRLNRARLELTTAVRRRTQIRAVPSAAVPVGGVS